MSNLSRLAPRPGIQAMLVASALVLTTWAAIRATLTGEGLALAFVAMPLAFFIAGLWLAEHLITRGARRAAAISAAAVFGLGVVTGIWGEIDPDRWRALAAFVIMLAVVPTLLLGMAVGAWRGMHRATAAAAA